MFADDARLHFAAYQEHRGAAAVVGAFAAVLVAAATELREGHDAEAVLVPAFREIAIQGRDAVRDGLQQVRVRSDRATLAGVRVEAIQRHVEDAGAEVGVDELSREFQPVAERGGRVRHLRLIVLADRRKLVARSVSVHLRASHEIEQVAWRAGGVSPRSATLRHVRDHALLSGLVRAIRRGHLQLKVFERCDRRHANRCAVERER